MEFCIEKDRKHYGKRTNGWLQAFDFLTLFSKSFFLRAIESLDCLVKG